MNALAVAEPNGAARGRGPPEVGAESTHPYLFTSLHNSPITTERNPAMNATQQSANVDLALIADEAPASLLERLRRRLSDDTGAATAEYAIATMASVAFAGLLVVIMQSDEVRSMLEELVRQALTYNG